MPVLTALPLIVLLQADPFTPTADSPISETCSVVAGTDSDAELLALASLRVIKLTNLPGAFSLPADAPANVRAVQCVRDSIVPLSNDYKVLLAGYPLFISTADGRAAVMELNKGQLQFSTTLGEFAELESPLIGEFLDQAQPHFYADSIADDAATAEADQPVVPIVPVSMAEALARAGELEEEMDFAGVANHLAPFVDSGDAEVEYTLANAYMNLAIEGKQLEEIELADIQPAIDLATRACEHGSAQAYNLLYMIYGNGWAVQREAAKSLDYLLLGVAAGDSGAKLNYAISLYEGSDIIAPDREKACPLFMELGEDSRLQALAAYYVGLITYRGECGFEADQKAGMELIEISANHDFRKAQRDVGRSLEYDWVQDADLEAALAWYQRAADNGESYSQWRIGMSYVRGEHRDADSARAVAYFEQSAASDDPNGLTSLAVMYVSGDGVAQDYAQARALYQRAASLGEAHAYRELALMYYNGEGVAVDLVHARLLYLQAVALGSEPSAKLQGQLEENMDAKQIEQSDQQFAQWQSRQAN